MRLTLALTLLVASTSLSGCGSSPEEKVADYLQRHKTSEAVAFLEEELKSDNTDMLLNALMAETLIQQCIETKCFDNTPRDLQKIAQYLMKVPTETVPSGEGERKTHDNIYTLAQKLIGTDQYPNGLIDLAKATPEGKLRQRFVSLLFTQGNKHLEKGEIPAAVSLLQASQELASIDDESTASFAQFLIALALQDDGKIADTLTVLKQMPVDAQAPEEIIRTLPYLVYNQSIERSPHSGTSLFLQTFPASLSTWKQTPLDSDKVRVAFAKTIYEMRQDNNFLEDAQKHMAWINSAATPVSSAVSVAIVDNAISTTEQTTSQTTESEMQTENTPLPEVELGEDIMMSATVVGNSPVEEVDIKDAQTILDLHLLRTAITLYPQNTEYWQEFIPAAFDFVEKTGEKSVLFKGASAATIPSEIVDEYNQKLFQVVEKYIDENKSIIPLISHIIIPVQKGELVREQANVMIKKAMDKAIEEANYDLIYTYSVYQPEIAKMARQRIVTITIDQLEENWKVNNFSKMKELADFLTKKMDIDFSLDSLLLQNFDDHLKAQNLATQLNADTPQPLLKPTAEVRILPDEKMLFLKSHFKETPSVLDNILKTYIVKAEGKYGTANALYRLYDLFDDSNFPRDERQKYLINSIKNSLSQDSSISATQMSEVGYDLNKVHPDLPLMFIAGEIVSRIKNLDEARAIWTGVPEDLRVTISANKPQLATLMEAVAAYENNDREKAADLFSILSDEDYRAMAKPYVQEYIDILENITGIYASSDIDDNMHTHFITVQPINTSTDISNEYNLMDVEVTFISAIGHTLTKSDQDLSEDFSKVYNQTLIARLNPETLDFTISEEKRASANLPQSFDKVFGEISHIQTVEDRLVVSAGNQLYSYGLLDKVTTTKLFPEGKFGIIKIERSGDEASAPILPIGTIIELKTQTSKPIQPVKAGKKLSVIYPVTGVIQNPAIGEARVLNGFFSPERHTLSMTYDLPLSEGATTESALRCQISGNFILCAAHNKMSTRNRYTLLASGQRIATNKPSAAMQRIENKHQIKGTMEYQKREQYLKQRAEAQKRMQSALRKASAELTNEEPVDESQQVDSSEDGQTENQEE